MKIDLITIFPDIFSSYINESIIRRARANGIIDIAVHNLRDFTDDKHNTVDDTPYGGGAGMVLKVEPVDRCVHSIKEGKENHKSRVILLSAKGKKYTQRDAERLKDYDQLIFICGRYEGVDERVAQHIADEEISIGDYVLTGGELGALVITDSVVRLLPDVLGNDDSAIFESHSADGYSEHPHYTKPDVYNNWSVPDVLLSGNHAAIEKWREDNAKQK